MKKVAFITAGDAEYGFKLAGVSQYIASLEDAENTLMRIVSEPDTGLVFIDERILKGITEKKLRDIEQSWQGILIVLPPPKQTKVEIEDYAVRLIRQAIGYHMRLRL